MSTPTEPLSMPETDTMVGTLVEERTDERLDEGDHERFAHYVKKDKIVESAVMGTPVIALCGKVWVPGRDPNKFPVCPDCKKIFEGIPVGKGGGDDGSDGGGS
ncbi:MAG TPA: DUF3039 domain-containing protein [Candidatus Nanopelagicales bacterium]|nr:DUF3039 domain-containing protein [Candidatus Nanopelagicales bacterium]